MLSKSLENKLRTVIETAGDDKKGISKYRAEAAEKFLIKGFPSVKDEKWRNSDLSHIKSDNYKVVLNRDEAEIENGRNFRCEIHNFDVYNITLVNGFYVKSDSDFKLPDGVIIGDLNSIINGGSSIADDFINKIRCCDDDNMVLLNTALFADGVFIFIPDNTVIDKPLQIVNLINHSESIFIQSRILIVAGSNSKVKIVQCTDAPKNQRAFENSVIEIFAGENSNIEYYKSQNANDDTVLINNVFVKQEQNSDFMAGLFCFNGGFIRNNTEINLDGINCESKVYGLYLMDRGQHVDNYVYMNHSKARCHSVQNFRGILDDYATGAFTGYIKVNQDAQLTEAYQKNNNILLTDKAKFDSSPFLEINADNVKCSHGATVGQLDNSALFYMRSRGIDTDHAKVLLMNAFAQEIVQTVNIPQLRTRFEDMVNKRLKGELYPCEFCRFDCNHNDKTCLDIQKGHI